MKTPRTQTRRIEPGVAALAIVAACILTGLPSIAGTPAPPDKPASIRVDSLTATVVATDPRAGTIDLLTGVGHALRIRRVQLAPEAAVMRGRVRVQAGALTPGCIVRIECRETTKGTIASRVELLRIPARERNP